ncbi:MAG: cation diffusion facilitator family transporter [Chloroflexi bacterium]|nr:cation diffusion facilitator family transporter [Chloroflexota bacterium]
MGLPLPSDDSDDEEDEHPSDHHARGGADQTLASSERGIWAVQWSFAGMVATAIAQLVVVFFSGSVALLADTVHNFGDATTAVPLWIAFALAYRRPSRRFTYGYGRVEDLAGAVVVLIILVTALIAGYQSVQRLLHPQPVYHLGAVALGALLGFLGNEAVAQFRLRVGREIGSAALVTDGYHARADGLVSLAVLVGTGGVWAGFPNADPIVGILITLMILWIVGESSRTVFTRTLDGVEPELVEEVQDTVEHTPGVREVGETRIRWLGHRLHAEINLSVAPGLSVREAHAIAREVRHQLQHRLSYLSNATIHVDPDGAGGEEHHRVQEHSHDGLPPHSHE